jgi:hypothetical protein
MLSNLPKELIYIICSFLLDKFSIEIFKTSKLLYSYAENYIFSDFHYAKKINNRFKYRALSVANIHDYEKIINYESIYTTKLRYGSDNFNFNLPFKLSSTLYDNITHLELGYFDQPLYRLPTNLKYLKINLGFSEDVPKLPCSLVHLHIMSKNNLMTLPDLPSSLIHLTISNMFDNPINFKDLHKLKRLFLYGCFNQSLDNLPDSLEILKFPYGQSQKFSINKLPASLKEIIYGKPFDPIINGYQIDHLPKHIKLTIATDMMPEMQPYENIFIL